MDYYQVLGVSRTASKEEIRKAFKKIARENHPDAKPDDPAAANKFKDAAEAYDVLGDDEKRKKYDQFGENWKHVQGGGGAGGSPFRSGGPVDIDLRDLFGGGGAVDLESLFGGLFGGGGGSRGARGRRQPQSVRGQDVKTAIHVPFQMSATGGDYNLSVQRNGRAERLTVKVPAGIESGKAIRLAGQGEPGAGGGPSGDLLVTVNVAEHPYFQRQGNNVSVDVPVTVAEAILGAKIDVPTLTEGIVTMTLPPGTSSGAKLRLKGKGFQNPKTKSTGDQYVIIKVVVPKVLDDESRNLIEQFGMLNPQYPRAELWT